jgi:prolyl-tRNA synthetase
VSSYDQLKQVMEQGGWARGWWAGSGDDEGRIKEETGATIRCFPFEQPGGKGKCFYTGQQAERVALFAKAY